MKRTSSPTTASTALDGISSRTLFDEVFRSGTIGMMMLDDRLHIVEIGQGLCDLLGYTRDELVGRHFTILVHPEERQIGEGILTNLLAGGQLTTTVERRYQHKNGTTVWVLGAVSKLTSAGGTDKTFIIAQITPIDKQKQAEAEAAEALKRWNFALEGAGQGVWDYDRNTSGWVFSPTWKSMRGIPEDEEADGNYEDWIDIIHPDDIDHVNRNVELQNSGKTREIAYEYREKHRDGHWMWILARGRCVEWNEDGTPSRIIGTDTDITDIKVREGELATMSQRLEMALSTSKVGVWETDLVTLEEHWDQRTYEIFDVDTNNRPLPVGSWERMLHPEDRQRTLEICRNAVEARKDYSLDYRIVTPQGETRHIRCRAGFTNGVNGNVRMIGVNWDVTEDIERSVALEHANALAKERNRQLELARASMEYASLHDSLTGLPNRRHLDTALSDHEGQGDGRPEMVILHIDLDRFKEINDTRGHAAGDAMLKHMARLLKSNVGKTDLVARIGGDEFVILLTPAPSPQHVQTLIDNIMQAASRPMMWQGQECRSGVSIGIAEVDTHHDPKQALVNADIALYRAKRDGRNRAIFFTDGLQAEITSRKQCADEIFAGLERGEFAPVFQPQFDAKTLDIVGVEALVRWHHPELGILTPDRFLEVAEDIGAVGTIDRTILEQSLSLLKKWDEAGLHVPKVSVNVSARRLGAEGLLSSLANLDFEPGRLSFELLESIFLDDRDNAITHNVDAIKDMGIDIDIDDFGTGHASIVSLLRLSPNRLKIDRQLVDPILDGEPQRRLVKSIVEIGKSQGIEVCAEGVESARHANILRKLGCDVFQGYHFARPMASDDLIAFIKGNGWRKAS